MAISFCFLALATAFLAQRFISAGSERFNGNMSESFWHESFAMESIRVSRLSLIYLNKNAFLLNFCTTPASPQFQIFAVRLHGFASV